MKIQSLIADTLKKYKLLGAEKTYKWLNKLEEKEDITKSQNYRLQGIIINLQYLIEEDKQ